MVFKTGDQEDVKVEAKIKLYGKMAGDSPMEAFLERSDIDVDDETISFQVPNKRVKAQNQRMGRLRLKKLMQLCLKLKA